MTSPGYQHVAVIGAGYVGLTTAAGLAHLGHEVRCSDCDTARIKLLRSGRISILEDDLEDLIRRGCAAGRLAFGADNTWAVEDAEFIFLCLPTPEGPDGAPDMSFVEAVAAEIGPHLRDESIVVNKSTVPVGTADVVGGLLGRSDVRIASNPEFLREGSAVHDFLHPHRIVIGALDEETAVRVSRLFAGIDAPVIFTNPPTAETIKYASNAFLATKVSFVNSVAALCEAVGADVHQVCVGMGLDPRIGSSYLRPGPGWGGSCFPKDSAALVQIAEEAGYDFSLLKGVIAVNQEQYDRVVRKAARLAGGSLSGVRVALWGVTFKARTDDLRSSPALEVAWRLREAGATVTAYDPTLCSPLDGIGVAGDAYAACEGASVIVLATEWEEFRSLDFDKVGNAMARRAIVDSRNLLDAAALRRAGFEYEGIGIL
ncbi:MAG: UDP-glucose/GDP-mannose dehydrogenase family protein [Actinomycetota bacterium]|nr:UDP-glucose/GDP-mannose dehydrogenase family protein [Actinomycetota bacterium]